MVIMGFVDTFSFAGVDSDVEVSKTKSQNMTAYIEMIVVLLVFRANKHGAT